MQSILLISEDPKDIKDYIEQLCKSENIDILDRSLEVFEKAVGIEDVRIIQKKIILKPFRSRAKAVIVQAQDITIEAQNALLKMLEEPPDHTIIVIAIPKNEAILPTILSRCKIISLNKTFQISKVENTKYLTTLKTLNEASVGERLKIAQDIAGDKDALGFIKNLILVVRSKLLENPTEENSLLLLKSLQKTYTIIKTTNVSKRVALESLFLSL